MKNKKQGGLLWPYVEPPPKWWTKKQKEDYAAKGAEYLKNKLK